MLNKNSYIYYGTSNEDAEKYFEITEESEDDIIEGAIERGREEYRQAWREYVQDYE